MFGSRDVTGHERLRVLVGSLAPGVLPVVAEEPPAGTILLDLGPDHPSQAGLIELRLWTSDGMISSAQVVVGAMHRGVEKLFEVRDYTQILMLADRHDWQAPFSGELTVARACEQMMGLVVPERAVWLRTLLAEHTRILSHAAFLTWVARVSAADAGLHRLREALREQTLALTGNRIHPMVNRIGGLAADADPGWLRAETRLMEEAETVAAAVLGLIDAGARHRADPGRGGPRAGDHRPVRHQRTGGPGEWGRSGPTDPPALPGVRGARRPDRAAGRDLR